MNSSYKIEAAVSNRFSYRLILHPCITDLGMGWIEWQVHSCANSNLDDLLCTLCCLTNELLFEGEHLLLVVLHALVHHGCEVRLVAALYRRPATCTPTCACNYCSCTPAVAHTKPSKLEEEETILRTSLRATVRASTNSSGRGSQWPLFRSNSIVSLAPERLLYERLLQYD